MNIPKEYYCYIKEAPGPLHITAVGGDLQIAIVKWIE